MMELIQTLWRETDYSPISTFAAPDFSDVGVRTLDNALFLQGLQWVQVKDESGKQHFHVSSNNGSHVGMSVMENILDDCVKSSTGSSYP